MVLRSEYNAVEVFKKCVRIKNTEEINKYLDSDIFAFDEDLFEKIFEGNLKDEIFYFDNVKFLNIGNDAIDFSGSNANISNLSFENVSDKLISVGENSNVKISNIKANKSYVGIASKDGSTVVAENIL